MRKLNIPLVLLLACMVGCTGLYTGVVTVTQVVDTAMKGWADLAHQGKTTPAIDAQVTRAHDKYRGACGVASASLQAYKLSGDPAQYQSAVAAAKDAASQLVAIIVPLLSPSQSSTLQSQLTKANTL
jgi:hypothetical protein